MTQGSLGRRSLVSVVVPVCNEEENLDRFYEELRKTTDALQDIDWEILFVDDGSTDGSLQKMQHFRSENPAVKIIQLSRNFGSHAAVTAGLRYSSGDVAIVISADLQDPPDLFNEFVSQWRKGYHIVWAVREAREDPWMKTFLANLFYKIFRWISRLNFPKGGMDCGLFDRQVVDEFLKIQERRSFLFATFLWIGFRQTQIPYIRRSRQFGVTKWSLVKRINSALDAIISFSYFPVRAISYLGIVVSFFSLIFGGYLVMRKFFFGLGTHGWLFVIIVILFFSGLQLIMMGVLGEYIWRISDEVKGRPKYIVMNTVGFQPQGERVSS